MHECVHSIEKESDIPFTALLEQLLNCVDLRLTRERGIERSGRREDEEDGEKRGEREGVKERKGGRKRRREAGRGER